MAGACLTKPSHQPSTLTTSCITAAALRRHDVLTGHAASLARRCPILEMRQVQLCPFCVELSCWCFSLLVCRARRGRCCAVPFQCPSVVWLCAVAAALLPARFECAAIDSLAARQRKSVPVHRHPLCLRTFARAGQSWSTLTHARTHAPHSLSRPGCAFHRPREPIAQL
jgi:hypothetical protein